MKTKKKKVFETTPRKRRPSAAQMAKFAAGFTKEQWDKCAANASFRDALLTDIEEARTLAVRLLTDKIQSTKQIIDVQDYYDDYRD